MAGESVVSYEYSDYGETTINGNIDFYKDAKKGGSNKIYDSRIVVKLPNRRVALQWERMNAERLRNNNHSMIEHDRP